MRRLSWIGQLRAGVGQADLAGTVEIQLWKIHLRDQELEGERSTYVQVKTKVTGGRQRRW